MYVHVLFMWSNLNTLKPVGSGLTVAMAGTGGMVVVMINTLKGFVLTVNALDEISTNVVKPLQSRRRVEFELDEG